MRTIDYSKTQMYKLVPKDLNSDLIYVGHTTNFTKRKSSHKSDCNNINSCRYNFKVYDMIRKNSGWDNWEMILIENFPCADSNEARKRERELMEEFHSNLNTINSLRTKNDIKKTHQKWYNENKNTYNINRKKERIINKDIMNAKEKIYRKKNKDIININKKKYYEKNKEFILAKLKEKRLQKKLSLDII
jgi:hypothetical protein